MSLESVMAKRLQPGDIIYVNLDEELMGAKILSVDEKPPDACSGVSPDGCISVSYVHQGDLGNACISPQLKLFRLNPTQRPRTSRPTSA